MHRICIFRLLMLCIILISVATNLTAQEPLTKSQMDSLIAERWDFIKLERKYPLSSPKAIKIIERSYPHEIDTLLAIGDRERKLKKWRKAEFWYNVVLMAEPDNLNAHYSCGICKREKGRTIVLLWKNIGWHDAQKHFEYVVNIDSTYKDVFYQYALLEQYRGHYIKAINLANRQLAIKDNLSHVQTGILKIFDSMIHSKKTKKVEIWLKSQKTIYSSYFLGELYRQNERFVEADSVFHRILSDPGEFSVQLVYLSLVRMYIQKNKPQKAEATYWRAVYAVTSKVEADLILDDFKYIVNEDEYDLIMNIKRLETFTEMLRMFWQRRDPTPAAKYNQRLLEHYRRLIYAEKYYRYEGLRHPMFKADWLGELQFPPWYYENDKFNDCGLIYIRFGKPDDWTMVIDQETPLNLTWIYAGNGDVPQMIFHFLIPPDVPSGCWSLTPEFIHSQIISDLAVWDTKYHRLSTHVGPFKDRIIQEIKMERAEQVESGFRNDRHTWKNEIEVLDMVHSISQFRETVKSDLLQLSYAIPLSSLSDMDVKSDSVSFEAGVVIFDEEMQPLFKDRRNFKLVDSSDAYVRNDLFIDEFEVSLPLGRYNIAIHVRTLDDTKVNGWRYRYTLPDTARDRLACSSLKLAFDISPKPVESDSRHRNDLRIIPNPMNKFNRNDPVYVYYEVYNLAYNVQGMTDYAVTFVLRQTGKKKGIVKRITGIFGSGEKNQVSVESDQFGNSSTAADYISFDMSRAKAGEYELVLKVRDKVSGEEAMAMSEIVLENE